MNSINEHLIRDILINFDTYFTDGLVIKNTTYKMDEMRQITKATRNGTKVMTVGEATEMVDRNLSVVVKELELNK